MLTKLLPPPGRRQQCAASALTLPTPANPRPKSNPPIFNDAMTVRLKVFIDEQKCSPEGELDEDDARSWHWVIYNTGSTTGGSSTERPSDDTTTTTVESELEPEPERESGSGSGSGSDASLFPIGVIRLVPPPHAPHHTETDGYSDTHTRPCTSHSDSKYDLTHEPYIKLTRVAILREYRGRGLAKQLVDLALEWAGTHAVDIDQACHYRRDYCSSSTSALHDENGRGQVEEGGAAATAGTAGAAAAATSAPCVGSTTSMSLQWNGLVLVHAQTDKEGLYARWGFERDTSLGKWDEEGIEHVGMWRRIEVKR